MLNFKLQDCPVTQTMMENKKLFKFELPGVSCDAAKEMPFGKVLVRLRTKLLG